jgi:RNA polymerase sigma factor (sigma-70 family)
MPPNFTDRYTDIRAQVRMYLRHEFRSLVDIDEVTDAVMERLHVRWRTIDEPLRWAISAAKHLAIDELRKAPVEDIEQIGSGDFRWVSTFGVVEQQIKVDVILEALQRLSIPERKALVLAALGFTNLEIAHIMHAAVNSVAHYLYEGRKKLGQILPYRRQKSKKIRRTGSQSGRG